MLSSTARSAQMRLCLARLARAPAPELTGRARRLRGTPSKSVVSGTCFAFLQSSERSLRLYMRDRRGRLAPATPATISTARDAYSRAVMIRERQAILGSWMPRVVPVELVLGDRTPVRDLWDLRLNDRER